MNQVSKIRILIVDDHAIVRMGLAAILGTKADLEVVGDAEDGTAAIQKAQKLRPDVVLMDIVMPEMDGATATAKILQLLPQTKVIILTSFGEADGIAHALDAGASGALMKNVDYSELVTAIRAVIEGETVVAPEIRKMIKDMPPVPELSERQRDILISISRLLRKGLLQRPRFPTSVSFPCRFLNFGSAVRPGSQPGISRAAPVSRSFRSGSWEPRRR